MPHVGFLFQAPHSEEHAMKDERAIPLLLTKYGVGFF